MKRAIATITIFVHGNNNQELLDSANEHAKILTANSDCNASVEQLHEAPFGKLQDGLKEINISRLRQ